MLDIRRLREATDDVVRALARRGQDLTSDIETLLAEDRARREALTRVNELKAQRNAASKEVGRRKRDGEDAEELVAEMRSVGDQIGVLDGRITEADGRIREILMMLPNEPLAEVPEGGAEANRIERQWGEPRRFDFEPRPHWEIGEALGILDLAGGARVSGSGFPVLRAAGARLQRGLIAYFLERHTTR